MGKTIEVKGSCFVQRKYLSSKHKLGKSSELQGEEPEYINVARLELILLAISINGKDTGEGGLNLRGFGRQLVIILLNSFENEGEGCILLYKYVCQTRAHSLAIINGKDTAWGKTRPHNYIKRFGRCFYMNLKGVHVCRITEKSC